jgi:hypothetical protein
MQSHKPTLFAFDCSGSIGSSLHDIYFGTLDYIMRKEYNSNRGDIIYLWGKQKVKITYDLMKTFITNGTGYGHTHPQRIVEMLTEHKNEISNLVITTDGCVHTKHVKKCDLLMEQLGWYPEFVTVFIIGPKAKDVSVIAPFCRNSPHIIYSIDKNGKVTEIEHVTRQNKVDFEQLIQIRTKVDFIKKYPSILNFTYSKHIGKGKDEELCQQLEQLQETIKENSDDNNNINIDKDYEKKIEIIKDIASGALEHFFGKTTDSTIESREKKIEDIRNDLITINEERTFQKHKTVIERKTNFKDLIKKDIDNPSDKNTCYEERILSFGQKSDNQFIHNIRNSLNKQEKPQFDMGDKVIMKQTSDNQFIRNIRSSLKKNTVGPLIHNQFNLDNN